MLRGEAASGGTTDAGADFLESGHQRNGEEHEPRLGEAELRAGLRVRGDAGGIIIGGTGDESGSEAGEARFFNSGEAFLRTWLASAGGELNG